MLNETLFRETFDQVHASDGLLTEVLTMAAEQKREKNMPGRVFRAVLIAAVLTCVFVIGAVASHAITSHFEGDSGPVVDAMYGSGGDYAGGDGTIERYDWGGLDVYLPAWSREPVDTEVAQRLVAPYLYTLEENTVTKGGFTYTIEAILYDSNTDSIVLYWSVENPVGLGDYDVGVNGEFYLTEKSRMYAVCGGKTYLDTVNSTDTKLYISSYGIGWNGDLWCEFGCWNDAGEGSRRRDIQRVAIPRNDRGGMESVSIDGAIIVSPVAIRLDGWDCDELDELVITYQDGNTYVVFSEKAFVDNTTYAGADRAVCESTFAFNRIVDVERIASVTVNGETYFAS